jgi:hypothetical protein
MSRFKSIHRTGVVGGALVLTVLSIGVFFASQAGGATPLAKKPKAPSFKAAIWTVPFR